MGDYNRKMTGLEKVALTSAVSGAVFNVFLYGIGASLATAQGGWLFILRVVAAILQAAAFDLVAIATVMGRQYGRWNNWSWATAIASAFVSALIALDVAGVLAQPWLHAANALIVLAFTLHLLAPQRAMPAPRARQLRRLVRRLCARLRQERATSDGLARQLRQAHEDLRRLEAAPRQVEAQEVIIISERQFSLRQIAQLTDTPLTTLRRRVAQIEEVSP